MCTDGRPTTDVEAGQEAVQLQSEELETSKQDRSCCCRCPSRCRQPRCWLIACGVTAAVVGLLLVNAYFVLRHILFNQAQEGFYQLGSGAREFTTSGLVMANITHNIWWPGCLYVSNMSDFESECGSPCFTAARKLAMQTLNEENPGVLVTYRSRPGLGEEASSLTGWWLPAPTNGSSAPRIVLQHGFQENSNHFRTMFAAYILRSLGFSVLMNNFRDHGYSASSPQQIAMWGDDRYVGDLLGAWDYAKNDPDGVLGGSLPASKVGLMGFSLGGFTTANAFGKEGEVPAAWIDGSPSRPDSIFDFGVRQAMDGMGIGFLADLFLGGVWSDLEKQAAGQGVLWSQNLPEKNLPLGPDTQRPTYLVANADDTTVLNAGPDSHFAELLATFEAYPSKYDVVGTFVTSGECKGVDHCVDHLRAFDEYSSRLCNFWWPVFGLSVDTCP